MLPTETIASVSFGIFVFAYLMGIINGWNKKLHFWIVLALSVAIGFLIIYPVGRLGETYVKAGWWNLFFILMAILGDAAGNQSWKEYQQVGKSRKKEKHSKLRKYLKRLEQ